MGAGGFDYSAIPVGFYDSVLRGGNPVRRLWHLAKFERVLDCLETGADRAILDIGCFAGSFLSIIGPDRFGRQLGVDILRGQIDYARAHYGTEFRRFRHLESLADLESMGDSFDCITAIEVIEHLDAEDADVLLRQAARLLRPGGQLVLTTPNYASTWPLLEVILDRFSDVKYQEQHVTKFSYFSIERKLRQLHPPFLDEFEVRLKTTSHFLTPFLAAISFRLAHALSRLVPHRYWRHPFGNLLLLVAKRRGEAGGTDALAPRDTA
ncbi:MAG TPA: class I SAM-dependent methyltransferase [Anaeromyxobacteraceae bacterium]|nr:class I SAM-dependent methyltransferase [Anaeromyxobacteraceae bacterium]